MIKDGNILRTLMDLISRKSNAKATIKILPTRPIIIIKSGGNIGAKNNAITLMNPLLSKTEIKYNNTHNPKVEA